jgi:hypothetical protein
MVPKRSRAANQPPSVPGTVDERTSRLIASMLLKTVGSAAAGGNPM